MKTNTEKLTYLKEKTKQAENFENAARIITFDQETVCPKAGVADKNELIALLENQAFQIRNDERFKTYVAEMEKESFDNTLDKIFIEQLSRTNRMEQNITAEKALSFSRAEKQAFVDWVDAKEADDFTLFQNSLQNIIDINTERANLRALTDEEEQRMQGTYDRLLDTFERGITQSDIDPCFEETKARLSVLLQKIQSSTKQIRTDFLSRHVPEQEQKAVTAYLMDLQGFDKSRGTFALSEHPYTDMLTPNDTRITTHIYEDNFVSNIYSVLHETGHALFEQNQPKEDIDALITGGKTLGMHESVSRFYENIIGRSEEYITCIFPKLKELMPTALSDVTAKELYEAVNVVTPSLIRLEADEVTYPFHIIIRYELEKEIFAGHLNAGDLPQAWKEKYKEYLHIEPQTDREGVLQDVHWASDFGYFPTYALGNFYNAMYYNKMKAEIDVETALRNGDFQPINRWMAENVYRNANRLSPQEWIYDITGRQLTADDFLTYLETKYERIYGV